MATRQRETGFRGGIERWVSREEARQIADEIAALDSAAELQRWCEERDFGAHARLVYEIRLGRIDDENLNREAVAARVIAVTAYRRRTEAICEYARERGLDLPTALGADGRSLARCPTCDSPLDARWPFDIFCSEHWDEEAREIAELLG